MSTMGSDKSGNTRLRCSTKSNGGTCENAATFYVHDVERLVIECLAENFATPAQVRAYAQAFVDRHAANCREWTGKRERLEKSLASLQRDNDRLLGLMVKGRGDEETLDRAMKDNAARRAALIEELQNVPQKMALPEIDPAAVKRLATKLTRAGDWLQNSTARARRELVLQEINEADGLRPLLRQLVETVTVSRGQAGRLNVLVQGTVSPLTRDCVKLVAEEGLEPPTRGL